MRNNRVVNSITAKEEYALELSTPDFSALSYEAHGHSNADNIPKIDISPFGHEHMMATEPRYTLVRVHNGYFAFGTRSCMLCGSTVLVIPGNVDALNEAYQFINKREADFLEITLRHTSDDYVERK